SAGGRRDGGPIARIKVGLVEKRAADTDGKSACREEGLDVVAAYAAGRNQAQMGQGGEHVLDVTRAQSAGWKQLDGRHVHLPSRLEFGRRVSAGNGREPQLVAGRDDLRLGDGRDDELRAVVGDEGYLFWRRDRTRADED